MVVIKVSNYVNQCYSNADGQVILKLIEGNFKGNKKVEISFEGIETLNTSFVNVAFIELLDSYSIDYIRKNLIFKNSTRQINEIIRRRFSFEVNKKKELINV